MKIIGSKNQLVSPKGKLIGGSRDIPILSLSADFCVGAIPTCVVGVPVEFLNDFPEQQTSTVYTVIIEGETMFTGYFSGESGRQTPIETTNSINLVHSGGRDLDQCRISCPRLHPMSGDDYNYQIGGAQSGSSQTSSLGFGFNTGIYFKPGGTDLATQIIEGIIKNLRDSVSYKAGLNEGAKTESFQICIDMLGKVKSIGGGTIKSSIAGTLSGAEDNSINKFVQRSVEGSLTSKRSVWDTLSCVLSQFGLYLLCDRLGNVNVVPDMAGFQPPDGNLLDGDYIVSHDRQSVFMRNIKEVVLITTLMTTTTGAVSPTKGNNGTLVRYPDNANTGELGGTMAINIPGWLNPIAILQDEGFYKEPPSFSCPEPADPATGPSASSSSLYSIQRDYAKMCYYLERNKLRSFVVTGPMAPLTLPGTVAAISPYSSMKTMSGETIDNFSKLYYGYCYKISHFADVAGKVMTTSYYFRNVTDAATGEFITEHPIFEDVNVPFTWL